MNLYYYQDSVGNFGDDLNVWLWPKLLPGLFDQDDGLLFVGIGSFLRYKVPVSPFKIVFGSGVGSAAISPMFVAMGLRKLIKNIEPTLSSDYAIELATSRLQEKLENLKVDYLTESLFPANWLTALKN